MKKEAREGMSGQTSLFKSKYSRAVYFVWLLFGAVFYWWMLSYGTFNFATQATDGRAFYFSEALRQMLHGHFDIPLAYLAANDLTKQTGECLIYLNKCYAYYGVAPSFLRLPFLIFGSKWIQGIGSQSMMMFELLALLTISFFITKKIFNTHLKRSIKMSESFFLGGVSVIGPQIFLTTRSYLYEEAILVAILFFLISIYFILKFFEERSQRMLSLSIFFSMCTVNSRISEGFALLPILFWMIWIYAINQTTRTQQIKKFSINFALLTTAYFSMFFINLLKYGNFIPSLTYHHGGTFLNPSRQAFYIEHGEFNLKRGFEMFLTWLLPNFRSWPRGDTYTPGNYIANFHFFSVLNTSTEQTESFVSISVFFVLSVLLTIIAIIYLCRKWRSNLFPIAVVLSCLAIVFITSSFISQTLRYGAEFYPLFLVGSILGIARIHFKPLTCVVLFLLLAVQFYSAYSAAVNFWFFYAHPDIPSMFLKMPH